MMVIQKHILCQGNAKGLREKLKHNVKYKAIQNYKHSINQNEKCGNTDIVDNSCH